MDHSPPQSQPANGLPATAATQITYANPPYQMPQMSIPTPTPNLTFQQAHQFHIQQHQQLQSFWAERILEIEQLNDFKNHSLPLARIKKIMKADEDVRMISAEAPVVFAKACEIFILELTLRSWINTEENRRRTLQKNDIAAAITRTDIFDFLVDIVPRDDLKEEGMGIVGRVPALPLVGGPGEGVQYYYPGGTQDVYGGSYMPWPGPQQPSQQQAMPDNG